MKNKELKNEILYILFEYGVLISILLLVYIISYKSKTEENNLFFALFICLLSSRHYNKGLKVDVEQSEKEDVFYTKADKKYVFSTFDKFALLIMMVLASDKLDFYQAGIVFVLWFILTDILRQRKTIYGTYISRWFYISDIEINNSKWELHITDVDSFPSVPHMHSIEYPLKLNIYTGEIYNVQTRKIVCKARNKELKKLWSNGKFRANVEKARKEYVKNNPKYQLSALPIYKV